MLQRLLCITLLTAACAQPAAQPPVIQLSGDFYLLSPDTLRASARLPAVEASATADACRARIPDLVCATRWPPPARPLPGPGQPAEPGDPWPPWPPKPECGPDSADLAPI